MESRDRGQSKLPLLWSRQARPFDNLSRGIKLAAKRNKCRSSSKKQTSSCFSQENRTFTSQKLLVNLSKASKKLQGPLHIPCKRPLNHPLSGTTKKPPSFPSSSFTPNQKTFPFRSSMRLLYQPRSTWLFGVRVFYLLLELGYCPYPKTSPRARTPRQHKPSQSRPLEVQAPRPGLGIQPLSPNTTTGYETKASLRANGLKT